MRLVLIPLLLLALAGCEKSTAAKQPPKPEAAARAAVTIHATAVATRSIERVVEISGSLAAPEDATVAAEVEGKIETIRVDLGDRVRKGQLLARINSDEYRLHMEQAEALRVQTAAALGRIEQLAKTEMVSPQQLDDARSAAQQAAASADLAKKKFNDTRVVAPFTGAVAKRIVSPGEYVRVGQTLFEVVALEPLKLTGEVPERFLSQVRIGNEVTARVDAFPERTFSGKVSRLSPGVNAQSRAFTVEAHIANPKGELKPGLFARARLQVGRDEQALVVPERALTAFAGVSRVFTVEGTVVHERRVEVVQHLPDGFAVVEGAGLAAGVTVATSGLGRLADGVEVDVR